MDLIIEFWYSVYTREEEILIDDGINNFINIDLIEFVAYPVISEKGVVLENILDDTYSSEL